MAGPTPCSGCDCRLTVSRRASRQCANRPPTRTGVWRLPSCARLIFLRVETRCVLFRCAADILARVSSLSFSPLFQGVLPCRCTCRSAMRDVRARSPCRLQIGIRQKAVKIKAVCCAVSHLEFGTHCGMQIGILLPASLLRQANLGTRLLGNAASLVPGRLAAAARLPC